ncbi:hypothetical protein AWZ03_013564, partial [Drosophila navojoa]
MTHYSWDEACYRNKKNDALSSADSRPINNSTIYNYDELQSGAYVTYDDEYGAAEEEYPADGEGFGSFNQNYAPCTTTATIIAEDNNPNIATVGGEYWRNSYGGMEGSDYNNGYNLMSGSLNDGSSIEGTYSKKGNRVGCRLPLAPIIDNSKYRLLSQPITYAQNVLNEHTVYADERIGSFISLPAAAPMRMLPEPHPRVRDNPSQRLFEDNNSLGGILTTTTTTTATTGTSQNYDVCSQISRPYTSMLPLDYGEYSDYAYNSDNLSAYSDTPPLSNTTQLKLQQQRRISLMLAMTTASVIASGETRIPIQQQQYYNTTRRSDSNTYFKCNRNIDSIVSTSASTTNSSVAFSNTTTGYYKPAQIQTDEPTQTPPKAKVSSVLGGLSKGIKGGLDGVLIGVSSTMDTTKPNPAAMDNDNYNELHLSHDSTYSTADDDYENSNAHMPIHDDNKAYSMHHSSNQSQNQNQSLGDDMVGKVKVLPTVPSAGSSGKKLPAINGKSGLILIKQQPTEIFDDDEINESDDDLIDNLIGRADNPSYCIDSEQNDYYMDHQQATPSNRIANDYYEHVGSGYVYREDFFNEEDEYKYIEQQSQQQQEKQQQKHQQDQQDNYPYQNSHKMLLSHKQDSIDYVDDGQNDDYLPDTYPSDEDCGNYLDESSSGSVGVTENRRQHLSGTNIAPVSVSMDQLEHQHQQIKKQDSIIIEEEESSPIDLKGDLGLSTHRSPERALVDHDHDNLSVDNEDQLSDLLPTRIKSQKKKKVLLRGETEEVVSGHMQIIRKPEITAKQRWHWAYNKIILQLN